MKKILAIALTLALTATLFAGCSAAAKAGGADSVQTGGAAAASLSNQTSFRQAVKAPKYVFLFIGDGMSFP